MNSVCKWGGSSLSTPRRVFAVAKYIKENNINIVVLSAPGKANKKDKKVTDLLISITKTPKKINDILSKVKNKYLKIITTLKIPFDLDKELEKIKSHYQKTFDNSYLISRGEYIMAKIFAKCIGYKFVDSKNLIKFDKDGKLLNSTYTNIKTQAAKHSQIVIPGFYGAYKGKIKVFSRGGSDITGAIVAKALDVDYYNFTDVDGIYNHFPLSSKSKKLKTLSYYDMKFLGLFGFSVLHHKCCDILDNTNIKTFIKSSFEPEKSPTTLQSGIGNIFASSEKELVLAQSSSDIYEWFLNKKVFVFLQYRYLNNYFYVIAKNSALPNGVVATPILLKAIVSKRPIKNAFCVNNNQYIQIKKVVKN